MSVPTGSLVETVAAAAVEGVLVVVIATAVIGTLGVTAVAGERALALAELARFEAVVTAACARVEQPADPESSGRALGGAVTIRRSSSTSGYASVRFLDRSPEQTLDVTWSAEGVEVLVGEDAHRFVRLTIVDLRVAARPVPHLALSVGVGSGPSGGRSPSDRGISLFAPFACLHTP